MTFLARLARFLIWLLLVMWSLALLRRVIGWVLHGSRARSGAGSRAGAQDGPNRHLHRDPLCGLHVAEEISFPLRTGGETLHFCSQECRKRYADSHGQGTGGQRLAANG